MGVPAHSDKDLAFANKNELKVIKVVSDEEGEDKLVESGQATGLSCEAGSELILEMLGAENARKTTEYRLRDWLISR